MNPRPTTRQILTTACNPLAWAYVAWVTEIYVAVNTIRVIDAGRREVVRRAWEAIGR